MLEDPLVNPPSDLIVRALGELGELVVVTENVVDLLDKPLEVFVGEYVGRFAIEAEFVAVLLVEEELD